MSRRSWSVQRRLVEIFEAGSGPLSMLEVAARLYPVNARGATDAQLSSVRRALAALVRKGVLTDASKLQSVVNCREYFDHDRLTAVRVAASDIRATVLRSRTLIEQSRAMLRQIDTLHDPSRSYRRPA